MEIDIGFHLPNFLKDFIEINEIIKTENIEFNNLENYKNDVKQNQFILTANKTGISKYEDLLKLVPNLEDSLSTRRTRVLAKWNDLIPYTYQDLIDKLRVICGDNFEVQPNFNEYKITITVDLPAYGQIEEVENMLASIIPANLIVKINNILNRTLINKVTLGSALIDTRNYEMNITKEKIVYMKGV